MLGSSHSRCRYALLLAVLCVASVAHAQAPCDAGYTYYPDIEDTEGAYVLTASKVAAGATPQFAGSCLRLIKQTDAGLSPRFPKRPWAATTSNFHVAAKKYCAVAHLAGGGRLVSFSSLSTSSNGLLAKVKALAAGASSQYVLVGGFQGVKAPGTLKHRGWKWTNRETDENAIMADPATTTAKPGFLPHNWAPGQPEYVPSLV